MHDEEFLKNFQYKVDATKAIFDLCSRTISIQASLSSLKDLVFENLKECTEKNEEELLKEYETFYNGHRHEILTDFMVKHGQLNSSETSDEK